MWVYVDKSRGIIQMLRVNSELRITSELRVGEQE